MIEPKHKDFLKILALVLIFLLSGAFVYAETAQELQQKIGEKSSAIDALQAEIDSYQKQLDAIGKDSTTLSGTLKSLDLNNKKLDAQIKVTQTKIKTTQQNIDELSVAIGVKDDTIDQNKQILEQNIRSVERLESKTLLESVLSHRNLSETWNDLDTFKRLQGKVNEYTKGVKDARTDLQTTKTSVEETKKQLLDLKSELADQKSIVEQSVKEKAALLRETKNKETNYKKILADKLALKTAFEKEVQDYESHLQYILNPNLLPKPGSGVLNWPVDSVFITQLFGKTSTSGRLYASGTHSGVDFRASIGTPVYAMASGTIGGTGDTDTICSGASFGKWVLVKFNNGLAATYGHLSLIKVVSGETVSPGQILGYSGNTGHSTAPHLHISLYDGSVVQVEGKPSLACKGKTLIQPRAPTAAYLDPMLYMPKTTADMFKPGAGID